MLDEGAVAQRAKLHVNIGAVLQEQGDEQGAMAAYREGASLVSAALGPDHPETRARMARVDFNLGLLAYEQRDFSAALELLAEVVVVEEPALAIKARTVAIQALSESEAPEQAILTEARALAGALNQSQDLPLRTRAEALVTAGPHLALAGDSTGFELLAEALAIYEQLRDESNRDLAQLAYAQALAHAGRRDAAREHLTAVAGRLAADDPNREYVYMIDALISNPPSERK
jgi:tetratricopeptide (TPR) repeat protein